MFPPDCVDVPPGYADRRASMFSSVIPARRFRGQYSHICASHLPRRVRILSFSSSFSSSSTCPCGPSLTSPLNRLPWPSESSRSPPSAVAQSSCWMRLRSPPSRSQASPRPGGNSPAISLRMRAASRHPRPLVVTPICNGPSVWTDSSEKVHSCGASTTLTGMRSRWHIAEMRCASWASRGGSVTNTASTTPSTWGRPREMRCVWSNDVWCQVTRPAVILSRRDCGRASCADAGAGDVGATVAACVGGDGNGDGNGDGDGDGVMRMG